MIQVRTFGALLALGALTALPGCSTFSGMFGGGSGREASAAPASQYSAPASPEATRTAENTQAEQQPVTRAMIRRVQAHLRRDRLYRGRIDGIWGPQSEHAAMQYQQQHQMNPTGKIDLPMLQAMNLGNGEQYGETNGGMESNGSGGQQYGEANSGSNGASSNQIPPSRNFTTGGQNNGNMNASNSQYNNSNPAPATGASGGTAGNGSNTAGGNNGGMNNGGANNTGTAQH